MSMSLPKQPERWSSQGRPSRLGIDEPPAKLDDRRIKPRDDDALDSCLSPEAVIVTMPVWSPALFGGDHE